MEAVIFIGLQAAGKSSFYKERYFSTHVRISLDLLRTRNRERRLLAVCLETQQPFVIDNTNPTREERAKYIDAAKSAKYSIVVVYLEPPLEQLLHQNKDRSRAVPEPVIHKLAEKCEPPTWLECHDLVISDGKES